MHSTHFSFYGVGGTVSSADPGLLEELRRDFEFFAAERCDRRFALRLVLKAPPPPPARRPVLRGGDFTAYDDGTRRIVDYRGRALAVLDFSTDSTEIFSEDRALLRELAYLLVCSRAGFQLDLRGLHRVHALGLAHRGRGVLVLLPSGGGKTTLLLDLLREGKPGLLSEDTPLVGRSGELHPFPLRLGVMPGEDLSAIPRESQRRFARRRHGEKILIDLPYFRAALSAAVPPGLVVLARRTTETSPRTRSRGRWRALRALSGSLVVGWGVPQLREFIFRSDPAGLLQLGRIGFSRTGAMAGLLGRSRVVELALGTDRAANSAALKRLMEEDSG